MPPWKPWDRSFWSDSSGSASLEFITAGLVLLVPMIYLILVMSSVQAGAFAAESAVRQAVRVFVQADDIATAEAKARVAIAFALRDQGIDPATASVSITCSDPTDCLRRNGTVTVVVDLSVGLPGAPAVLPGDFAVAVPVHASAAEQVSRFAGGG